MLPRWFSEQSTCSWVGDTGREELYALHTIEYHGGRCREGEGGGNNRDPLVLCTQLEVCDTR